MKNTYLIIGSGRLAHHLKFWFASRGMEILGWDRSQDPHLLNGLIKKSTHILLAIKDDAIQSFHDRYLAGFDKKIIQFSGSQSFPGMQGAHPLMTFSHQLYDENFYEKINWMVEGSEPLPSIFPELKNPFFNLPVEKKPLYHALCVVGGNLPQILWSWIEKEANNLNIPKDVWEIYWETSLKNFVSQGPTAITGPLVRNDKATLDMDLAALQQSSTTELANIFQAFIKNFSSGTLTQNSQSKDVRL
ncbi:MAG: DUF2520 domain-containing protein [Bdellovibrionota bacterium]